MGTQALDVVRRNPDRFRVVGLSAGANQELLVGQIREFLPPQVAIADEEVAADVRDKLAGISGVDVLAGPEAAETLARDAEADMVLNALVGSAGLGPTLATLQAVDVDRTSKDYAAANDVVRAARKRVVEILQASGGAAVPAQRSDWYWEEYAMEKGSGTEVLVFVRYDVSLDAVKALVEKFSTTSTVGSSLPCVNSQPVSDVVVVLPCVPATTTDSAPQRNWSRIISGSEQ